MATVGTVDIMARMNVNGIVSGASKATSAVAAMGKNIAGTFKAMATSIVPVFDVGSLIGGIKSVATAQSKYIDDTGKLADRLGTTTEAIIGIQHAANLAGVGFDESATMLEKFQKNLGKAAEDGGHTVLVMRDLGLNMDEVAKQPIDKTFFQVAEAVSKIEDPLKRTSVMIDLFGKSGQKLTNTFIDGGKGLKESTEEAAKLGMAFSRIDASMVEAANDAFTRLQGAIAGVGNVITIGLAPFIEKLNVAMTEFIATNGPNFGKTLVNAFTAGIDGAQAMYAAIIRVGVKIGELMTSMGLAINKLGHAQGMLDLFGAKSTLIDSGKSLAESGNTVALHSRVAANDADRAPRWSESMKTDALKAATEITAAHTKVQEAVQKFGGIGKFMSTEEIQKKFQSIVFSAKDMTGFFKTMSVDTRESFRKMGEAIAESLESPIEKFQKERTKLTNLNTAGMLSDKDTWRGMKKASDEIVDASPIEQWMKRQKELRDALDSGAIDQEKFNRATVENQNKLEGAVGGAQGTQSPQAAEFGTSSAANAVAQFRNQGQSKNLSDLIKSSQNQEKYQARMADATERQADALTNIQTVEF